MMSVRRAGVHFLAAEVSENAIGVARVLRDERLLLGERTRDPFLIRIVECESHAENNATNEALAGIGRECGGIFISAIVEKVGCDEVHGLPVEIEAARQGSFCY